MEQNGVYSSKKTALIFCSFGVGLPLLLQCIALATDHWSVFCDEQSAGLWRICDNATTFETTYLCQRGRITAVWVLECLGLYGLVIAAFLLLLQTFYSKDDKKFFLLGIAIEILAGLCILVGAIVYARAIECLDDKSHISCLQYSFTLSCVSGVLCKICAFTMFVSTRRSCKDAYVNQNYLNHKQEGDVAARATQVIPSSENSV